MSSIAIHEREGEIVVEYLQQICCQCILPETFPGISFADSGICSYCTDEEERVITSRTALDEAIAAAFDRPAERAHDALALFSGGKDSSLALKIAVEELGLRVVAFTLDNGFLSAGVSRNMARVLDAVGVEHVIFRPPSPTMHELYRISSITEFGPDTTKYSTAGCGSCISMVLASALRFANEGGIRLLVGGWTPGQFGRSPLAPLAFMSDVVERHFGPLSAASDSLSATLDKWREASRRSGPIGLINPLYALQYSEADTIAQLEKLGWEAPADTDSCSTNCRLNGYLTLHHIARHGFHPYMYELAHHVRAGALSRSQAWEKVTRVRVRRATANAVALELHLPPVTLSERGDD